MCCKFFKLFSVIYILSFLVNVLSFNLSPYPGIVFSEPPGIYLPKERSSYFGYSLCLRESGIIVGAPRAHSNIEAQRTINETGVIYKCIIKTGKCAPFIFDAEGNTPNRDSEYTYDSERKDFQWLGAAIDGGPKDTDPLVVCAPRRYGDVLNDYSMHGVCYWTSNSKSDQPLRPRKISPLRLKTKQKIDEINAYYYQFGGAGLSVHLTSDNEEIIIGAPGIFMWSGSVIRYHKKIQTDIGGLNRRDTSEKQELYEYESETPNPSLWNQREDSYFGYSVTSGFFDDSKISDLLYVATAPQIGEAYIFDIVKARGDDHKINKYITFHGSQFGEYFGYSVLAEDLNGDTLTDLIISAPQYSENLEYENGAVYVFTNEGKFSFHTERLAGRNKKSGRFGTVLAKLGDINHDGFNDIAISAPFEDDGVVYIYLGCINGVQKKPSQILKSPALKSTLPSQMFGHGISKGFDIDNNEFNDVAIGAPNGEKVYLYKAYPVVKIIASMNPLSRSLSINSPTKFQMEICYRIETTSTKVNQQEISIKIVADSQVKRVKLSSGSNRFDFTDTATKINKCRLVDANVKVSIPDIFKPIVLEMGYELVHKIPNQPGFCENCVAIDPLDPVSDIKKIPFSTGCKNDICEADLKLKSFGISSSYVIGSSKTISVKYEITNDGEAAYLPQINVTSSNHLQFAKIPSACKVNHFFLLCSLNEGQPLHHGMKDTITILFDTTEIDGESIEIRAQVSSAGNELNDDNNIAVNLIALEEYSTIEAVGQPITPVLNLEEVSGIATITNQFEIHNTGPSRIKVMNISLSIPISYLIPNSHNRIPLIDFNNITINASYNNYPIKVEFYQNGMDLLQNHAKVLSLATGPTRQVNNADFDTYNINNFMEQGNQNNDNEFLNTHTMNRKRRSTDSRPVDDEYARISQKTVELKDDLLGKLPVNRTIIFDCNKPDSTLCIDAVLRVINFRSGNTPVSVNVQYNIDLAEVDKLLVEPKEFFVVTTKLDVSKGGDEKGETIALKKTDPHNIISKHQIYTTPVWVYVVSILGGLLLLALVSYGLYRFGFFKREKKEELQKLHRESQHAGDETDDDDN